MELPLTVSMAARSPVDVLVRAEPDATIGELAAALAQHLDLPASAGQSPPALYLGPSLLAPGEELSAAGLLQGSVVGMGMAVPAQPNGDGPVEVAVLGGPAAGPSVALSPGETVTVGRSRDSGLTIEDPQVSRNHARVTIDWDGAVLEDAGSTNGVGWAGHRILGAQRLAAGDVFQIGDSVVSVREVETAARVLDPPAANGTRGFNRPPRIAPPALATEIEVPVQPTEPQGLRFPLISLLAPVLIGVALVLLLHQIVYLAFVALSPVMVLSNYLGDRRRGRRDYRTQLAAYQQATATFDATMSAAVAADERLSRVRLPDPAAIRRTATAPTTRLWERRREDNDFLRLRIGLADAPAHIQVKGGAEGAPPLARLVPAAIDVAEAGIVGLAGPRPATLAWARAMLSQTAALHSPGDVRIVVLTGQDGAGDWAWTAWLPHLVPPDPSWDCSRLVGVGRQQVEDRLTVLRRLIDDRLETARSQLRAGPPLGSRILVVLDGARRLRTLDGIAEVLRRGPEAGVFALCLDEHETSLPEECQVAVVASNPSGSRAVVHRKGAAPVEGVIVDGVSTEGAERVSRALASLRESGPGQGGRGVELPRSVRLLDLLGLDEPTAADVAKVWRSSPGGRSTEAIIGMATTGPFVVDLRKDGPHGLVAGTTGAGKSELLQSLVASLALANRPDALTFVLVDYKGGSAFRECRDLPHCVGLITDLDGHLAARALASLTAELKRREGLLAQAGARDIDEYWALTTGLPSGPLPSAPLPRLAIVIDEFATLVEEVPDFVRGVIGIGMRGRSLGVHVILATQRPAGVVSAELRANVNLRLCLRVANPQDSTDVIDGPDAARIGRDTPGRAYALTGYRDLTPFQTARIGVARPGEPVGLGASRVTVAAWSLTSLGARRVQSDAGEADSSGATDLSLLVAAIEAAARNEGIERPPSPWLPPLPDVVSIDDVGGAVGGREGAGGPDGLGRRDGVGLRAVVGLVDRPESQTQEPFVLDLDRGGSVLVIGTVRSGRSTALRTIAAGLASRLGPEDLHLYVIDCGNRALDPLASWPHCGAVVSGDDPDRLTRLVDLLGSLVQARARTGHTGPPVVVLIDRLEAFVARYAERDGGRLVDAVDRLLREGRAVGVTFVISGDRTAFSTRLASAVESRLVLRQADRSDYGLLGLDVRQVPSHLVNGRAVWAQTGHELQIAVLGPDPADAPQSARGAEMAACGPAAGVGAGAAVGAEAARRARRVDPLPTRITLAEIEALTASDVNQAPGGDNPDGDAVALVGAGGDELCAVRVDLTEAGPGFVVAGPPRSGRSTALAGIVRSLSGRAGAARSVVIVTPRASPLRDLGSLPGVAAILSSGPELAAQMEEAIGRSEGPKALVIDDAELLADGPAAKLLEGLVRTARDNDLVVVVAATTDDLLLSRFRGWLAEVRRSRSGLLLTPAAVTDGEVFDLRLPRSTSSGWPPGRALLVLRGEATSVQVAMLD